MFYENCQFISLGLITTDLKKIDIDSSMGFIVAVYIS